MYKTNKRRVFYIEVCFTGILIKRFFYKKPTINLILEHNVQSKITRPLYNIIENKEILKIRNVYIWFFHDDTASIVDTEAATENIFENICSFLPGAPFSGVFVLC